LIALSGAHIHKQPTRDERKHSEGYHNLDDLKQEICVHGYVLSLLLAASESRSIQTRRFAIAS
jgi:hypothetical protein